MNKELWSYKLTCMWIDYTRTQHTIRTWIKILAENFTHEFVFVCMKRRQINAKSTVITRNNDNVELGPQSLQSAPFFSSHVRLIDSLHVAKVPIS